MAVSGAWAKVTPPLVLMVRSPSSIALTCIPVSRPISSTIMLR
jgi:hypothetical protein